MTRHERRCVLVVLSMSAVIGPAIGSADAVRCLGRVVDSQGRSVGEADVTLYEMVSEGLAGSMELHQLGQTATASDGRFVLEAEPNATRLFVEGYVVAHKRGQALAWAVWKMREDVELALELARSERLAGTVVDETGQAVSDADVRAHLYRTVQVDGKDERQWLPGLAPMQILVRRTDARGAFVFDNLPAGVGVDLLVTAPGKVKTYTYRSDAKTPAFKAGQENIVVVLAKEARIEGRILDDDTGQGFGGARFGVVATFSSLFYDRHIGTADPHGNFSIGGLKAGRHLVKVPGSRKMYVETDSQKPARVTLHGGKLTLYYGRVLFDDGAPAVITPAPFPEAGTKVRLIARGGTWRERVCTLDDEGYFSVCLSSKRFRQTQAGQARLYVYMRYRKHHGEEKAIVSAVDLLATDKAHAGVVTVPRPYVEWFSLAGRALPALDQIGHAARRNAVTGKSLLVCFFDLEQRPSRHALLELKETSEALAKRDVIVLAVQTPKVESNVLDGWLKRDSISLPVGQVAGSSGDIRRTWGVKSLPWLLLTDCNHRVVAEGIALDEVDRSIED